MLVLNRIKQFFTNIIAKLKKIFGKPLIVIIILAVLGGIVWLLDFLAVINVHSTLAKIPVVNKFVYQSAEDRDKIKRPLPIDKTPAEKQNDILKEEKAKLQSDNSKLSSDMAKLKADYLKLQKQLEISSKEKQMLIDEKNALQASLDSMQSTDGQQQSSTISYKKLAAYYAEMKADSAVKIMNNLSDEVVIGILQNLDDDQVAKILSTMDPKRAAGLVNKMKQ